MSRWSEFGFPDLNGVSAEKAIAGLRLALYERLYAIAGDNATLPPAIVNHLDPIWQIENYLRGAGVTEFLMPDGITTYSGQAAAEYLGEELIPVPQGGRSFNWSNPHPPISREWLQQRYRMVNLIYQVRPSRMTNWSVVGYGEGRGYPSSEAWAVVDANYAENDRDEFDFRGYCEVIVGNSPPIFICQRSVGVPVRFYYGPHIPGDLVLKFRVGVPYSSFAFDDFGTGITQGEHTVTIETPADVSFGDIVDFPGSAEMLSRLRGIRATESRGFSVDFQKKYYDIRKGLEFYDEI